MTNAILLLAQNNNDAAAGVMGLGCILISVLLGVVALGFWLWMLIDAIQNPRLDSNTRLIWILVIVFTGWIGALIYLLAGRNRSP